MGNVSEPCTPYQNHHHQLTMEKAAGSDGKSLPAASNGMSNIKYSFLIEAHKIWLPFFSGRSLLLGTYYRT